MDVICEVSIVCFSLLFSSSKGPLIDNTLDAFKRVLI